MYVTFTNVYPATGGSITSVSSASGPPPVPSATTSASTSGGGDLSLNLRGGSRGTSAPSSPAKSRESLLQRVQSLTGAARDQGANLLGEFVSTSGCLWHSVTHHVSLISLIGNLTLRYSAVLLSFAMRIGKNRKKALYRGVILVLPLNLCRTRMISRLQRLHWSCSKVFIIHWRDQGIIWV